jgi:hypothetical protein
MKRHMPLMTMNGKQRFVRLHDSSVCFRSVRKRLAQCTFQDDERIATLEQQLVEAQLVADDSDRKYDEVK